MFVVSYAVNATQRMLKGVKEYKKQTRSDIQKELNTWKNFETQPIPVVDLDLYKVLQSETQLLYIALYEPGDVLAGVASCMMDTSDAAKMPNVVFLSGFLVHPSMRRRGIGKEMFENLVQYLRFARTQQQQEESRKFKACVLHSEDKNLAFWKNLGCVTFDPSYFSPNDALNIQMFEKMTNSKFLMFKLC